MDDTVLAPAPRTCCLSSVLLCDVSSIISKARRTGRLELSDVWAAPCPCEEAFEEFAQFWRQEQQRRRPSLMRVMFKLVRGDACLGIALQGLSTTMELSGPVFLNGILRSLEIRQSGRCEDATAISEFDRLLCRPDVGYALCGLMCVSLLLGSLCKNHSQLAFLRAALKVRGTMIRAVFEKMMRLSSVSMCNIGSGMIHNLAANDTEQLLVSTPSLANVIYAPIIVAVAMAMLAMTVGPSFLGGFAAMSLILVLSSFAVRKVTRAKARQMRLADARVKLMGELLSGVRVVKAYGWEAPFEREVMGIRGPEAGCISDQNWTLSLVTVAVLASPVVLAVVTFSTYTALGNEISAPTIFTAIALLNIIRFPMAFLPLSMNEVLKISLSMARLRAVLGAAESDRRIGSTPSPVPSIVDAQFGYPLPLQDGPRSRRAKSPRPWSRRSKVANYDAAQAEAMRMRSSISAPVVEVQRGKDIVKYRLALKVNRFEAVQGGLTIIVGPVGSGKSTLLAALLGDVDELAGERESFHGFSGPLAYCSQVPWIVNATVAENICFALRDSSPDAASWYDRVLDQCCLRDDLALLPGGDATEIGERGINLSGGQRARIAIARTVYRRDAELYLFDDPLAAIDAHVGKRLFDNVFGRDGCLAQRTRVLVTHQVQYLPQADRIVVVDGGEIVASGSYEELSTQGALKAHGLLRDAVAERHGSGLPDTPPESQQLPIDMAMTRGKTAKLTLPEQMFEGSVRASTISAFFSRGFGCGTCFGVLCWAVLAIGCRLLTDLWLALWTAEVYPWGLSTAACIGVYFGLGIALAVAIYVRSVLLGSMGMRLACRELYRRLLSSVLGSPVVFFDVTPVGRLLNRFSGDMDVLDNQLPRLFAQAIACMEVFLAIFAGIVILNPWATLAIVPVSAGYFVIAAHYRYASRDSQRLEAVTKTPVFTRISEVLSGLDTVRAYGYQEYLVGIGEVAINQNQACNLLKVQVGQWLSLRLEVLSVVITTVCAVIPLLPFNVQKSQAAFVGVTLTYSLELSRYVQAIAKAASDVEQKFTSVERILEFSDLPQEAAAILPGDAALGKAWPQKGAIQFCGVTMRYRPNLEPAVNGLSFAVSGGEKLGVVGRTGSGKSSIIVTLLRLTEVESGRVLIDGRDLASVGLKTLRQSLAMIPQEPVLFGRTTIRRNLDPFEERSDAEIWEALERVQPEIRGAFTEGLGTEVQEGGAPFSVGQRQLLCLARAVLRRSRIVILDEATASVDNETDQLIQRTIREAFAASTVVCVAHRIGTIIDSDWILVMGAGRCQEMDRPQKLLRTPGSQFRSLAEESGISVPPLE